ncbi:hypothetical protein BU24DRAFT_321242, partial [Aaosphaeria arxii CBS 175.79]
IIVFTTVFWAVAVIAIILRVWCRSLKGRSLVFNDYAVLVAFVFTSGLSAILITSVVWAGAGHHVVDISPQYRNRIFILFAAGQSSWAASNTFVKLSILHFYTVIFPSRKFRIICIAAMVISGLYFTSVLLETFLLCTPVQYNWDKTISGTCSPHSQIAYIIAGATNLVIDVFIVLLPMPILWKLQISWTKKLLVMAMFSLGAVICIISLLRVINVAKLDLTDFTYACINLSIWAILEPTLGIVNACLPVFRPIASSV